MIPSTLTRKNIEDAIEQIDRDGVPPARQSVHYDLYIKGNPYPPKYVVSLAAQFAYGVAHGPEAFNAVEAKNYFIKNHYRIVDRRLVDGQTQKARDFNDAPPGRSITTTYRILRDTDLARQIKALHEYYCQICGHRIQLADGSFYAEAHHVRPLGMPHDGPDIAGNIICVCPNHHAELDYGVIPLSARSQDNSPDHALEQQYVDYHNQVIYSVRS
jgi:hypothetical protein